MKFPTLTVLVASLATLTSGCATSTAEAELHANAFDVMTDADRHRGGRYREALGERTRESTRSTEDGFVTAGGAAFTSRERLSYERRVDGAMVRAHLRQAHLRAPARPL